MPHLINSALVLEYAKLVKKYKQSAYFENISKFWANFCIKVSIFAK